MHGPATTPDNINAIPDAILATTPDSTAHKVNLSNPHSTSSSTPARTTNAHNPTRTTTVASTTSARNTAHNTAAHITAEAAHTGSEPTRDVHQGPKHSTALEPLSQEISTTVSPDRPTSRSPRRRSNRWLRYAATNRERGMSTAEYAVGTIAACAFAALLFKVVSSPEVQEMLSSLIDRALNTNG